MKEKIYQLLPHFLQNLFVSFYNIIAYKARYGGRYKEYRQLFYNNRYLSLQQLKDIQRERYRDFILKSMSNSKFYENLFKDIPNAGEIQRIRQLPILSKEQLRNNINDIIIRTNETLHSFKTGGTTGKSLEVKCTAKNSQERFAMLDDFRSRYGYELGKKTAWFSGKKLLSERDIVKRRFWKTDFYYRVRYYSTFHIKESYLKYYIEDLIKFKPQYLVGFPSTMYEIAKFGLKSKYDFPKHVIKAVFPTAETLTTEMRNDIEAFFKTKMYNQYASSEGAPFIFECKNGNLHLELQSGVFEVLNAHYIPAQSGKLIVTSFTTEATPLIRYDIGDSISLKGANEVCNCGNNNPMVNEILGRIDDFIYSPDNGKINLGNVSNTLKDTVGIIKFQAEQNELSKITLRIVTDSNIFTDKVEAKFIQNWRDRIGDNMKIEIMHVESIPPEKSGKFRIVKNNIKHLLKP